MGRFQTHQREASLNLVGAIIPPWRGVPDVTSVDRKSRSLDRFTGNSPCSRRAILGWPSQPTRAIRAGPRTPVRARPSAKRSRGIRCDRLTRRRPVRIRRKWISEAPRLAGQGKRRWIMRLLSRARLLLALSLLTSVASACAECAWVFWGRVNWPSPSRKLDAGGVGVEHERGLRAGANPKVGIGFRLVFQEHEYGSSG